MRAGATMVLAAALVGIDAGELAIRARAHDTPDPVHDRSIKRQARKQQREQAKRLAKARKGVHP